MFYNTSFYMPILEITQLELKPNDAFLYGCAVVLVGVIAVLAFLLVAKIFRLMFNLGDNTAKNNANQSDSVQEIAYSANRPSSDEEIVAVIAAAIAMAESENSGLKFKVVSFRRV